MPSLFDTSLDPYMIGPYWQYKVYYGPEPYADLWNYKGQYRDPSYAALGPLASYSPQVQALIDQGLITRTQHQGINESGEFNYFTEDFNPFDPRAQQLLPQSTVPNNKINWMPFTDTSRLINPSMVYHDPNYGWLTPTSNDKANQRDWMDLIGPLAMGAITLGAGAIAAGAAGAGTLAGGLGAGAAGEVMGGIPIAGGLTSTPWYIPAGMSVARQVGGGDPSLLGIGSALLPGLSEFGIPSSLLAGAGAAAGYLGSRNAAPPKTTYNPAAYGNMGSVAAVNDGSSQRVATAVAPNAYSNSYNQVTT